MQLKLTDSDLGPEQYRSSACYEWNVGVTNRQLLFIFPTRVNLTTITVHYYSDSIRGLPRLSFFGVPDDVDIWDALTSNSYRVRVVAVPPGVEPTGRTSVSINFNFNTKKVVMYMYMTRSDFKFAVSEVEFFTCSESDSQIH